MRLHDRLARAARIGPGRPDPTGGAWWDGWLHTGDAGYLEGGYLFVTGRLDEMIVTGGENAYPAEVAFCREHQVGCTCRCSFEIRGTLPKTGAGKIHRRLIAKTAAAHG